MPYLLTKIERVQFNFLTLEMDILVRLVISQLFASQSLCTVGICIFISRDTRLLRIAKAVKELENRIHKKRF